MMVRLSWDKYQQLVEHLKQIAKPDGAWNNDMKIYLEKS